MKPITNISDAKNQKAFDIVEFAIEKYKSNRPFVIGITGAGGAGKTTFGKNIEKYYGSENCVSIDLDDYLISRNERGKLGVTGYNPKANNLFRAGDNISDLCSGKTISKPIYNHSTGELSDGEVINPKELIIIEGVTTLYPELRELNDVSFFLDALEETQLKSRIERDVKQRGYSFEEALILFESVKPDYKRFIEPTKRFASIIFEVGTDYVMHPIHIDSKFK